MRSWPHCPGQMCRSLTTSRTRVTGAESPAPCRSSRSPPESVFPHAARRPAHPHRHLDRPDRPGDGLGVTSLGWGQVSHRNLRCQRLLRRPPLSEVSSRATRAGGLAPTFRQQISASARTGAGRHTRSLREPHALQSAIVSSLATKRQVPSAAIQAHEAFQGPIPSDSVGQAS